MKPPSEFANYIHEDILKAKGVLVPLNSIDEWKSNDKVYYQIHRGNGSKIPTKTPYFKFAKYDVAIEYKQHHTPYFFRYHNFVKLIKNENIK